VFEQQECDVVVGVAAGVPVRGCHQGVERLVAAGGGKRCCDCLFWQDSPRASRLSISPSVYSRSRSPGDHAAVKAQKSSSRPSGRAGFPSVNDPGG